MQQISELYTLTVLLFKEYKPLADKGVFKKKCGDYLFKFNSNDKIEIDDGWEIDPWHIQIFKNGWLVGNGNAGGGELLVDEDELIKLLKDSMSGGQPYKFKTAM